MGTQSDIDRHAEILRSILGLENVEFWARGARSIVYRGMYRGVLSAIKVKADESQANDALLREANGLQIVNEWRIGPRLLAATDTYVITQFEFGLHIRQWLPTASPQRIELMLRDLFRQAFLLDFLGYAKGELHRLSNNLIIGARDNPILIDFERLGPMEKPKNVTQIAQYLSVREPLLHELGIHLNPLEVSSAAATYKQSPSTVSLGRLLDAIFSAHPHDSGCSCSNRGGSEIEKFRMSIPTKAYSQTLRQESQQRAKRSTN